LTQHFKVYSVEHDPKWVGFVKTSTYIHAPIKKMKVKEFSDVTGWYDPEVLKENLPPSYDLILVDGPPSFFGRGGFYEYIHLFNTKTTIFIDDVDRDPELNLVKLLSKKLERPYHVVSYRMKKIGIIPALKHAN